MKTSELHALKAGATPEDGERLQVEFDTVLNVGDQIVAEYIRKTTCQPLQIAMYVVWPAAIVIAVIVALKLKDEFTVMIGVTIGITLAAIAFTMFARRRLNMQKLKEQGIMFEELDGRLHHFTSQSPLMSKYGIVVATDHHELNIVTTYTRNGAYAGRSLTQIRTPVINFSRKMVA